MADITLKLVWYRLGENWAKMAENVGKAESWFSRFTWEDHILDALLVGWLSWAFVVVLIVNALVFFFGPIQRSRPRERARDEAPGVGDGGGPGIAAGGSGEGCQWLNCALNWFYLHHERSPLFVDAWLMALNEQAALLGGPVQVKVEKVHSGSLPPKLADIHFEVGTGPRHHYVFCTSAVTRDLSFSVFASQQTHQGLKLTNCLVNVIKLRARVVLRFYPEGGDVKVTTSFDGRPDVKVEVKPVNPHQDPADLVDIGVVEEVMRNTLCLATATFNVSQWLGTSGQAVLPRPEVMFESLTQKKVQHAHTAVTPASVTPISSVTYLGAPPKPPRAVGDKHLLVKVIKASSLGGREIGSSDPYCMLVLDVPPQRFVTSVVKNTVNPFWDEHFLLDVSVASRELRFEIYDKGKSPADEFLGEAVLYMDELKKNQSSRQIIPMQSRPGGVEFVTGSLTAEFLFMEPNEADLLLDPSLGPKNFIDSQISPHRRFEGDKSFTPGGSMITATTATASVDRLQQGRTETGVEGPPYFVEKCSNPSEFDGSDTGSGSCSSPYLNVPLDRSLSGSSELIVINGVESVAETAIRELMEQSKRPRTPTRTSTLIITGVKREPIVPVIKTIESTPTDETVESPISSTNSSERPQSAASNKDKKKSYSLAQTIKKRFSRSKTRSQSADRASSVKDSANYLRPPEPSYASSSKSTGGDDIDGLRATQVSPNLKKSRSFGGSLRKLFRRGRKRSRGPGDTSRESSFSRSSARNTASQGPSREGSITRLSPQQRASVS